MCLCKFCGQSNVLDNLSLDVVWADIPVQLLLESDDAVLPLVPGRQQSGPVVSKQGSRVVRNEQQLLDLEGGLAHLPHYIVYFLSIVWVAVSHSLPQRIIGNPRYFVF